MLAVRRIPDSPSLTRRSRDAFTLVEVLVVVAILVILAGVGTVGLLRYLDDAKVNNARLNAQNIQKAMKSYRINSDQSWPPDLTYLIGGDGGKPYIEGGAKAITDPWGNQFQFTVIQDQTGDEIPVVFTFTPQGRKVAWPREYGDI